MSGERDLQTLLSSLTISIADEIFVFATIPPQQIIPELVPQMRFEEAEGTTLIITKAQAEQHGLAYEFASTMITLAIHSSLEAVGFMAHISARLAEAGISCNPVAGFYHDHLFVPVDKTDAAKSVLLKIASG